MIARLELLSDPRHPRHVDLRLTGDYDLATRSALTHACSMSSLVGRRRVRFDLLAVGSIDDGSLRLLERTAVDARADGGTTVLLLPRLTDLHVAFAGIGPAGALPCFTDVASACAVFGCGIGISSREPPKPVVRGRAHRARTPLWMPGR